MNVFIWSITEYTVAYSDLDVNFVPGEYRGLDVQVRARCT